MTIRKRLSISNILMLISPIVLTMMLITCLIFVYTGVTGINSINVFKYENLFFVMIDHVDSLVQKWTGSSDLDGIQAAIDQFNQRHNERKIYLAMYHANELIYPKAFAGSALADKAFQQDGAYAVVDENISFYRTSLNEYTLILVDENFTLVSGHPINARLYLGAFIFIFAILAIVIINRVLTRFVFQSIITPIHTIVNGVHEIRDGNLSYRMAYDHQDEFAVVCADFNEMAARLSEMVNERQKDESSRRELIAGISHDLRSPLTSIKAYLEGIEKGVASTPESRRKYFDIIKSKTNDLEYTINQLFLFSKLDIGEFPFHLEDINIGQELRHFAASHQNEYDQKGLVIQMNENVPSVYARIDVVQFRNVLSNILENSVRYKDSEYVKVRISCLEEDGNVIIEIADNGPGVSAETLSKMFDVFYRNDTSRNNPSKGSGLGLAISKKIIESSGGRIEAQNAREGGLAMRITLPISKQGGDEN